MEIPIHRAMAGLVQVRPIFYSECDFQLALAWRLKELVPPFAVRLERPIPSNGGEIHVDICACKTDGRAATPCTFEANSWAGIELKYWTRSLEAKVNEEHFRLKTQSAHPILRYHFWHDVGRLEELVEDGKIECGYAVALTNDPQYWTPGGDGTSDERFRTHEGRAVSGVLRWKPGVAMAGMKSLAPPIPLRNTYRLHWADYSTIDGSESDRFRYLALRIPPVTRSS